MKYVQKTKLTTQVHAYSPELRHESGTTFCRDVATGIRRFIK